MNDLLYNAFIDYYYTQLKASIGKALEKVRSDASVEFQTLNDAYFEISDAGGYLQIFTRKNNGTSRFKNNNRYTIAIINYDKFITSLPCVIQKGKKRCDAIIYSMENKTHLLLCELKISKGKTSASRQLSKSLEILASVTEIKNFIDTFQTKRCCKFIKKANAPDAQVDAPAAFNRINTISSEPLRLKHDNIERFGFELYQYSGTQCYNFNK